MSERRKRILLLVLGLMLVAYSGEWLWSWATGPFQALRQKQQSLEKDIEKHRLALAQARRAAKEMAVWRRRSLPADPQVARSVYQAWLLQIVKRSGLTGPAVDSTQPAPRGGYSAITFTLQARGSLDEWVRWLHEFYRAGHLHQIRSMALTPVGNKGLLDVAVSIETLALDDAELADRLGEEPSDRLAFATLADYRPILDRNLFGGSSPDPVDQTYLTAIQHVNGIPEAWFTLRAQVEPDRSVVKLQLGQRLSVGPFSGTVVEISRDDVILESADERWLLAIGDCLTDAVALPPDY